MSAGPPGAPEPPRRRRWDRDPDPGADRGTGTTTSPDATGTGTGTGTDDTSRTVVRQSRLTGAAAALAVGSGLLLDLTVAATFGATGATDAFVVAARIPLGLLAVLMATANQALVPAFSHWVVTKTRAATSRLVSGVLAWTVVAAAALALLLGVLAGPLAALLAPGLDTGTRTLAAELIRVFVLVVPLTAGSEVLRAYLNARSSFVLPAAVTVVLNAVATATVLLSEPDIHVLPVAYLAGASAQFLVLAGAAWWRGLRFVPARPDAPELRQTARLTTRPLLAAGLNPLARVVELLFVSFLPAGAMTVLHYANRLVSAIGGTVLFRGVMTALVPRMARAEAEHRRADVGRLVLLGLRLMLSLSLPLTAGLAVLAVPGAQLVFARGQFDTSDATLLGLVLVVYSGSFVGSAVQRALLAPAYGRLDTRTPLRNTAYGVGSNLLLLPLAVVLFDGTAAVLAVAGAYALSQYVHVAHALHRLRATTDVDLSPALRPAARALAGSLLSAGVMAAVAHALGLYGQPDELRLAVGLAVSGGAGLLVLLGTGAGGGRAAARLRRRPGRSPVDDGQPGGRPLVSAEPASAVPLGADPSAGSRPSGALRRLRSAVVRTVGTGLAAAAAVLLAVALAGGAGTAQVVISFGGVLAVGLVLLAMVNVEAFLLCVLVVRASLDALKLPGGGPAGVDPAAGVAVLLSAVVATWVLAQRRADGQREPLSPLARTLLVFVAVAALGVVVSPDPATSLVEWARLASVAPMLVLVEQLARSRTSRVRVLVAVYASALVPVVVAARQASTGADVLVAGGFERLTSTFTHSNPFSVYLAFLIVTAVALLPHTRGAARAGTLVVLAATVPPLLLTYTRGSWIAALVGLLVVGLLQSRRLLAGMVIGVVVVTAAVPSVGARFADLGEVTQVSGEPGNSLAWRLEYWSETTELARESPIAGVGLKTVAASTEDGKQPHNDVIRAYVELGIAGLLAYVALLVALVRAARTALRRTGGTGFVDATAPGGKDLDRGLAVAFAGLVATFLVLALVANVITQVVLLWYFMTFAGLAVGATAVRSGPDEGAERGADVHADPARQ